MTDHIKISRPRRWRKITGPVSEVKRRKEGGEEKGPGRELKRKELNALSLTLNRGIRSSSEPIII